MQYRWEPKTAVGCFTLRRLVREGRSQGDGSKQLRSLQWLFFACTVVTTASRERQCLRLLTCCNSSTHDDRRKRWLFLASHATLRTAKVAQRYDANAKRAAEVVRERRSRASVSGTTSVHSTSPSAIYRNSILNPTNYRGSGT